MDDHLFREHLFGEAKVSEDNVTLPVQEKVLQFYISVDDAQGVEVAEGKGDFTDEDSGVGL